jgi:hypothetical protein
MTTKTKAVTWPYATKTIAIGGMPAAYTCPNDYSPAPTHTTIGSEIGLEIFPPLYIYQPSMLYMHLNYTFNSVIASSDQVLVGIYVRDTSSSYVRAFGSTVEKFMPLNIQADVNRNINISLDISSLLTGQPTNVVFLRFHAANAWSLRTGGNTNGDTINIWKLDLTYQTIGVRNEK